MLPVVAHPTGFQYTHTKNHYECLQSAFCVAKASLCPHSHANLCDAQRAKVICAVETDALSSKCCCCCCRCFASMGPAQRAPNQTIPSEFCRKLPPFFLNSTKPSFFRATLQHLCIALRVRVRGKRMILVAMPCASCVPHVTGHQIYMYI